MIFSEIKCSIESGAVKERHLQGMTDDKHSRKLEGGNVVIQEEQCSELVNSPHEPWWKGHTGVY